MLVSGQNGRRRWTLFAHPLHLNDVVAAVDGYDHRPGGRPTRRRAVSVGCRATGGGGEDRRQRGRVDPGRGGRAT